MKLTNFESLDEKIAQAIADGINELGWTPDVPNENDEMLFGPECHEVQTIMIKVSAALAEFYGENGK
ncbi:MAG: hypothetical protein JNL11_10790 [Bdellovibrionaceae bacterium]|nr:hypothetical protein [Pseudobdellovibrionaceae bacterium]